MLIDLVGAVLAVAFWVVVLWAGIRLGLRAVGVLRTYGAGRETLHAHQSQTRNPRRF